jgi:hypothetical protein
MEELMLGHDLSGHVSLGACKKWNACSINNNGLVHASLPI